MTGPSSSRSHAAPLRVAWLVMAGVMAIRLAVGAKFPLVGDETYYWEWSRHLAAGYFDHPPALAWCIAAGRLVFGDTALGVRLVPIICGIVTAIALMYAARFAFDDRAALRVAIVSAVLPLSAAGLLLATPDAPLMAAAAVMLFCVVRALDRHASARSAFAWWCATGVAAGAAMDSKFTGVLIPAAIAFACVCVPAFRRVFRTPGPYVAVVIASVVVGPMLYWNATHDWIAFRYQLQHGLGSAQAGGVGGALSRVGKLLGGQLGLTAIVLGALMVVAVFRALFGKLGAYAQFFAVIAASCFAFFIATALRKPVEANWPAIAYPSMIVLLAGMEFRGFARGALMAGYAFAGAVALFAYAYAVGLLPPVDVAAVRDPFNAAYGWNALADSVQRAARDDGSAGATFLAADRYQDASQLAFHAAGHPETFSLNLAGRRNQYDLWTRFPGAAHAGDALVVALDESDGPHSVITQLTPHFASIERSMLVQLPRGDKIVATRRVWVLRGWLGTWPELREALR